jgi:hypothetical protein
MMKRDAAESEAKTLSVPEAGWKYFRLGRNGSYEAAKRGDIPVMRIGSRLRVPVVVLERKLAQFDVNTPSAREGRRRRRCTNREAQYE